MSVLDTLDNLLYKFNSWLAMDHSQGTSGGGSGGSGSSSGHDSQDSGVTAVVVDGENRHEILYFAYGSNLSTEQMRERCPHSTPVGLAYLKGWKWLINGRGYANIVQLPLPLASSASPASSSSPSAAGFSSGAEQDDGVYGMLYLLPPQDEERLDRFEGVPWAYEKLYLEARYVRDHYARGRDPCGEEEAARVRVLAYVDLKRAKEGKPKAEYVGRMERGIGDAVENWGLDEGYANRVMRRFWR